MDVGHGNATILVASKNAVVIDVAPGSEVLDLLASKNVQTVDALFLSHADADHIGGVSGLLSSKRIRVLKLFVNPDPSKRDTAVWRDLRTAIEDARGSYGLQLVPALNSGAPPHVSGNWSVEIVAPDPAVALGGVQGRSLSGQIIRTNRMSGVFRVSLNGHPVSLVTGDLDEDGLKDICGRYKNLKVDILVFPHHGGMPASVPSQKFVDDLIALADPEMVVISNSRSRELHPHEEIIAAIRGKGRVSLACTQLTRHCSAGTLSEQYRSALMLPSKGRHEQSCCAGSILIEDPSVGANLKVFVDAHADFVRRSIPGRRCRQ